MDAARSIIELWQTLHRRTGAERRKTISTPLWQSVRTVQLTTRMTAVPGGLKLGLFLHLCLSLSCWTLLALLQREREKKKKLTVGSNSHCTEHDSLIHSNQFLSSSDFILAAQTLTDWVDEDKWNCFVRMAWGVVGERGRKSDAGKISFHEKRWCSAFPLLHY